MKTKTLLYNRKCAVIISKPSDVCKKMTRADATEHTTWKALFCSVFDVFLCSKGNFVSSWKDDNARRAYFLMLYAKCNTWCTSISSFRKFNFKYASEVSTTFLRTYRVVSRPLKILFNHSVIDQKDKETFFFVVTCCQPYVTWQWLRAQERKKLYVFRFGKSRWRTVSVPKFYRTRS